MTPSSLEEQVRTRLRTSVTVEARGRDDYRVVLPFTFPDGDALKIILKRASSGAWELTDEGHTQMFLSYYDLDLTTQHRQDVIHSTLLSHSMSDRDGRFVMADIPDGEEAGAIFTFAQGLLKLGDLSMWTREREKERFIGLFRAAVAEGVRGREYEFDYYDPEHDPKKLYMIDSRVTMKNHKPLYLFGVNSDEKANKSLVTIYFYLKRSPTIPAFVFFSETTAVGKKTRDRVDDAADKTLSSLDLVSSNLDGVIKKYEVAA